MSWAGERHRTLIVTRFGRHRFAMKAADIMSTDLICVDPATSVLDVACLMLNHDVSALPVVGSDRRLLGIISEGDLMRRAELGSDRRGAWWLHGFVDSTPTAADYVKAHARTATDVMTRNVVSVSDDTPIAAIVDLFEEHRIKRVPVLRDEQVVGIVSRSDIVRALVSVLPATTTKTTAADDVLREAILGQLRPSKWWHGADRDVIVTDGIAHVWGDARSAEEADAIRVIVENIDGVRRVKSHLSVGAGRQD